MNGNTTVFIVDDDFASRMSIAAIVNASGLQAETFASAEEFLNSFDPNRAGCVVTDLRMLGMDGIELIQQLSRQGVSLPVIVISGFGNVPVAVRALHEGAITFLEKTDNSQELWDAIRRAVALQDQNRRSVEERNEYKQRIAKLTPEERQVLELMAAGRSNKEIAAVQNMSLRTVEKRRSQVFKKTKTTSLAELVRILINVEHER